MVGSQPEIDAWLRRRRALGQDGRDEIWEGTYHVAPHAGAEHATVAYEIIVALAPRARAAGMVGGGEFNLGEPDDFRVPDGGWFARQPRGTYVATAVVVLEVLSPDDETFAKFDFYAGHGVREVLVGHPSDRWVRCWRLDPGGDHHEEPDSATLAVSMAELQAEIRWP